MTYVTKIKKNSYTKDGITTKIVNILVSNTKVSSVWMDPEREKVKQKTGSTTP